MPPNRWVTPRAGPGSQTPATVGASLSEAGLAPLQQKAHNLPALRTVPGSRRWLFRFRRLLVSCRDFPPRRDGDRMTEQAALLAAIVADPDDDTARLAYADWLDENRPDRAPSPAAGA